jgi:hypothetical protein
MLTFLIRDYLQVIAVSFVDFDSRHAGFASLVFVIGLICGNQMDYAKHRDHFSVYLQKPDFFR